MSNITRSLFQCIYKILAPLLAFLICAVALAGNGESFIGRKLTDEELKSLARTDSFAFTKPIDPPRSASGGPLYLTGNVVAVAGQQVLLLGERGPANAGWTLIYDVINVPRVKGLVVLSPLVCTSEKSRGESIIALGKWSDRKKGGGYASYIARAWRVDFEEKKFKEISTKGVRCEDDTNVDEI